jgi:hypothetical protein
MATHPHPGARGELTMAEDQGAGAPAGGELLHVVGLLFLGAVGDSAGLQELLDQRSRIVDEIYESVRRADKYAEAARLNKRHAAMLEAKLRVIQFSIDNLERRSS